LESVEDIQNDLSRGLGGSVIANSH